MSDQNTPETNTPEKPEKENRPKDLLGLKNGKEWSEKRLRQLLERSEIGVWGDEPSDNEEVKVLRAGNYKEIGIDLEDLAYRSISNSKQGTKELKKGDIVVERSGGSQNQPVGRVLFFDLDKSNFYPGNFLQMLRPNSEKVNNRYLYDQLQYRYWRGDTIPIQSNTTNIRNLQTGSYLNWNIPVPEVSEQRRIASVLYNVDQAIQKTEEIIEQTRRVKKGLMQELLIGGNFENKKEISIGPKKYDIPENWRKESLKDILRIQSGNYFKKKNFVKNGVKCLKIDNVGFGRIFWESETYLPKSYLDKYDNLVLEEGDLLMAMNRPIVQDEVKVGIVKESDAPSILYQRVGRLLTDEGILNKFLKYSLRGPIFKNELKRRLSGTNQPYVNNSDIYSIELPIPPQNIQKDIADKFTLFDQKIEKNRKQKAKLQRIKTGLMQDLLTGKVRTKDKDIEVLDEVFEVEKS